MRSILSETQTGPFSIHKTLTGDKYYAVLKHQYLQHDGTVNTTAALFNSIAEVHHAQALHFMEQTIKGFRERGLNSQSLIARVEIYATPYKPTTDISHESPTTKTDPTAKAMQTQIDSWAVAIEPAVIKDGIASDSAWLSIGGFRGELTEEQKAILNAINPPATACPLVDASAQAINGGKSRFDPEAEAQYRKVLEAMPEEQRQALTTGSWDTKLDELTDMSSDDMLDFCPVTGGNYEERFRKITQAKDAEFGPDEAHIDPHQADHEPTPGPWTGKLDPCPEAPESIKQVRGELLDAPSKLWLPEDKSASTTNTADAQAYLESRKTGQAGLFSDNSKGYPTIRRTE